MAINRGKITIGVSTKERWGDGCHGISYSMVKNHDRREKEHDIDDQERFADAARITKVISCDEDPIPDKARTQKDKCEANPR